MFETVSDEMRLKALLDVVRSLIVNSQNAEIFRLEEIMRDKVWKASKGPEFVSKGDMKEKIKEEVKARYEKIKGEKIDKDKLKSDFIESRISSNAPKKVLKRPPLRRPVQFKTRRVLTIPKVYLPRHLSNVKPVATEKVSIDLGKLNPFVQDPNVMAIETEGENQKVYVSGSFGKKPTNVALTKSEIDEVIKRFSEKSKIPTNEGLFKVAVGKLLLTATISDSVGSRFIIEKIRGGAPSPQ